MSQRIADCLEVLDLIRSSARHSPGESISKLRIEATAHVASRGDGGRPVFRNTVHAHLVGKNTQHKLDVAEIDRLITGWIRDDSPELMDWVCKSSVGSDDDRAFQFFRATTTTPLASDLSEPNESERHLVSTYRILRDTALARRIKADHDYTCQICHIRIVLNDGTPYAEAHHVKPLGAPHNGPDLPGNIVCLCPNCHVKFDYGAIEADGSALKILPQFIEYHNEFILKKQV